MFHRNRNSSLTLKLFMGVSELSTIAAGIEKIRCAIIKYPILNSKNLYKLVVLDNFYIEVIKIPHDDGHN